MTDVIHYFTWPRACMACGASEDVNSSQKSFKLLGGMSTHHISSQNYRNDYHYIQGTAYLCENCEDDAYARANRYIPRIKTMSLILNLIGLSLIPLSIIFLRYALSITVTPGAPIGYLFFGLLFAVPVICMLGWSVSGENVELENIGPCYFFIGYKHSGIRGELLKFSSPEFASLFRSANPHSNVQVGRTASRLPMKRPHIDDCLVGCCCPLFIIAVITGILIG